MIGAPLGLRDAFEGEKVGPMPGILGGTGDTLGCVAELSALSPVTLAGEASVRDGPGRPGREADAFPVGRFDPGRDLRGEEDTAEL